MDIFNPDFADFIHALNGNEVEYMLVGGYAVILRGYSRSTGDLDIWVNRTPRNYEKLVKALLQFGLPKIAVPKEQFLSDEYDVFSFGRPPYAIEVMTQLKGIQSFDEAFPMATLENVNDLVVRVIHLKHLVQAKAAAGRHKDKNDIENLPHVED